MMVVDDGTPSPAAVDPDGHASSGEVYDCTIWSVLKCCITGVVVVCSWKKSQMLIQKEHALVIGTGTNIIILY